MQGRLRCGSEEAYVWFRQGLGVVQARLRCGSKDAEVWF